MSLSDPFPPSNPERRRVVQVVKVRERAKKEPIKELITRRKRDENKKQLKLPGKKETPALFHMPGFFCNPTKYHPSPSLLLACLRLSLPAVFIKILVVCRVTWFFVLQS